MSFVLGLTGGIGSGKSAASQWFEQQGIDVVDADLVAHAVVAKGQPALEEICQAFGKWVIQDDGTLNRRALREYIFKHPEARKTLEEITHPKVRHAILEALQQAKSAYVILVSPLLFETQQQRLVQRSLLIDVSEDTQLARASLRDQTSPEQIRAIMAAQMPRAEKLKLADDVVENEEDLASLYRKLNHLHQQYLSYS